MFLYLRFHLVHLPCKKEGLQNFRLRLALVNRLPIDICNIFRFYLSVVFSFIYKKYFKKKRKKAPYLMKFLHLKKQGALFSVATGFEPVTQYEIAFQVQRLNRSAKRPNSF
jgi:hypothetical protein